jgi:hypothetical protein
MEPEPEREPDAAQEPQPLASPEVEGEMDPDHVFQQLRSICSQINAKLGEVQQELQEHKCVPFANPPLPPLISPLSPSSVSPPPTAIPMGAAGC